MAAENSSCRSSSRGVSSFENRPFFSTSKPQLKTTSDKLAWFSPVCSPLRSPGRETAMQMTKKKLRQSSIFSIPSRSKGAIDTEDPTSPKVSCIGQVRGTSKKTKDPLADTSKKKPPQWKPGSASPARFFASPGRSSKWNSLFGSRKEGSATPHSSCFNGDHELEKQSTLAGSAHGFDGRFDPDARGEATGSHAYVATNGCSYNRMVQLPHLSIFDANKPFGSEKSMEEQHSDANSRQRLTYEELPSLHSGASGKQNMKISVEVVPETWLCKDGEKLRPDGMLHAHRGYESHMSVGRQELAKAHVDMMTPSCNVAITEAKKSLIDECTSHISQLVYSQGNDKEVGLVPDSGPACALLRSAGDEKLPSPTTLHTHTFNKGKTDTSSFGTAERVEVNSGLQFPKKFGHNDGKQSYGLALPQLVEKKVHSACSGKECCSKSSIFKNKKSQALSAQPFSALILVGYGPNHQPTMFKYGGQKMSTEELLKGVFEVGRLSFHGSGKYFHVLKGGAEFIRSRSATSQRTVIQLQRCNSDPCRPSL